MSTTQADEHKTEDQTAQDPKQGEATVTLSQDKLDSLINDKFKKGAEKANAQLLETLGVTSIDDLKALVTDKKEREESAKSDLDKALEAIEMAKGVNTELMSKYEKLEETNKVNTLATQNGGKDVEYFAFKYAQAKTSDDFNAETFVKSFIDGNPATPPKTDTSRNSGGKPAGANLKSMSISELREYQRTL